MGLAVPKSFLPKKILKFKKNRKTKEYFIGITLPEEELILDYDDLICINHQLMAIKRGWAWPLITFFIESGYQIGTWT